MDWLGEHGAAVTWLTGASVAMIVGTVVVVPAIVARIPADYFARDTRPANRWAHRHRVVGVFLRIGANVVGWVLVLAGIAMLALPGQGVLTLLLGLFLVEFPGRFRVERWIVSRGPVLRGINRLRARRGKEPLVVRGVTPRRRTRRGRRSRTLRGAT